jgi:hypothetical protein
MRPSRGRPEVFGGHPHQHHGRAISARKNHEGLAAPNLGTSVPAGQRPLTVEAGEPGKGRPAAAAALQRFEAAGLDTTVAEQDVCCHAVQDKVFVAAPDPLGWWEFYSVTDDNPTNPDAATTSVCAVNCAAQDSTDSTDSACCA